jgi:signal transduction histidine kinase
LPNDRQLLVLDRLLYAEGSTAVIAVAHVATSLDDVTALVRRARTILIVVTLLGTIGVVIVSFLIARTMIEPIVQLTTAMAEIGSDRLDRRIASTRTDEVGRLAAAFNAMLARLQEAFARERQFISDASHELKTPLTVINANAQMLKRWGTKDPSVRDESIDAIIAESSELASMVTGMLTLAKADSGDQIPKDPLELDRLASDVVAHARDRAARKGLAIEASCQSGPAVVLGDEMLLRQMVTNLVDNAIKFTEQGRIDVMVTAANGRVALTVADTGIGISAATADRLFDRFYRGDSSHSRIIEGTGLGLAIVRSIVRVHNGTVGARPRPDGGSIFQVDLPALEPTVIESQ